MRFRIRLSNVVGARKNLHTRVISSIGYFVQCPMSVQIAPDAKPNLGGASAAIAQSEAVQTLHKTSMNHPRRERSREYLAPDEVHKLLNASRKEGISRNRERDYCLLLLMFRHGLRVSEACHLKVTDVNLKERILHVHRLKNGQATTQPMYNGEVSAVNGLVKGPQGSAAALQLPVYLRAKTAAVKIHGLRADGGCCAI